MLQKVPLHIASAEANLKEAIRKSTVAPTIVSAQPASASSTSSSRKRKLSKNPEEHTPSPSVTKRRRVHVDSGCTAQQQLPSPKSSRDSLLTKGGLPTANQHRSVGDALRPGYGSFSRSITTTRTPNPGQRSSIQPPTPIVVPSTPSRTHPVAQSDGTTLPTASTRSHKRETRSNTSVAPHFARPISSASSVTPAPLNHLNQQKDTFKAPNPFYIHTPLRAAPKHPDDWSTKPSAPPPSSIGFSAVRLRLTHQPPSVSHSLYPPFLFAQRRGKRFIPIDDEDDEIFDD